NRLITINKYSMTILKMHQNGLPGLKPKKLHWHLKKKNHFYLLHCITVSSIGIKAVNWALTICLNSLFYSATCHCPCYLKEARSELVSCLNDSLQKSSKMVY